MIQTVSSRRPSLTGTLLAIVGLALLVWQVRLVGLDHIGDGFKAVGWRGFLAILGLSLFRFAARSMAWITLIGRPVPLSSATAATISGDALGNLSFLSLLVSEPAKAFYVTRHAPAAEAFAALTAENFFYSVSVASVILGGTITLLATFVVPDSLRVALWFSLGVVIACEAAFHLASIAEAWLTLRLLTGSATLLNAFLLDTVNRFINVAFRAVPLRVGVDEVTTSGFTEMLGLGSAAGLTLALVRKARMLVWAGVGLGLLGRRAIRRIL